MKYICPFLLLVLLVVSSCSDNDSPEIIEPKDSVCIDIQAFYTLKNQETWLEDNFSTIYVYYGRDAGDISDYNINRMDEHGRLINDTATIIPDEIFTTDSHGKYMFTPKYPEKKFVYIIRSNNVKGIFAIRDYHYGLDHDKTDRNIFNGY